jgi:hypothetical protein
MIYTAFGGQTEPRKDYFVTVLYNKDAWHSYVDWIQNNCTEVEWVYENLITQRIEKLKGVRMLEEDTVMFKLRFGI